MDYCLFIFCRINKIVDQMQETWFKIFQRLISRRVVIRPSKIVKLCNIDVLWWALDFKFSFNKCLSDCLFAHFFNLNSTGHHFFKHFVSSTFGPILMTFGPALLLQLAHWHYQFDPFLQDHPPEGFYCLFKGSLCRNHLPVTRFQRTVDKVSIDIVTLQAIV